MTSCINEAQFDNKQVLVKNHKNVDQRTHFKFDRTVNFKEFL